jgi:galactonate dehydratase
MKIVRVETFRVVPRWLFLRIETDTGVVGWGEPVVEGRAGTVEATIAEFADYLIGSDPLAIEDTWQVLTRSGFYRGGAVFASAVAGVDQALWDIAGKSYGVPVTALLGGAVRNKARVYAWVGGDEPSDIAQSVADRLAQGFTAVKMMGSGPLTAIDHPSQVDAMVERVAAARSALGRDNDLMIDFHGRVSPAMARRLLPLLEPFLPLFVEEPVVPELAPGQLASITSCTSIPIATGERAFSRWDFKPLLDAGIAVAQPDVSHAGGISETRRIAAMAETYGVATALHCPLGPIALAASLQVDFAIPNFLIQEMSVGIHYHAGGVEMFRYVVDPTVFDVVDGHAQPLVGAGLGIEINEAEVRRAGATGHEWRAPMFRHFDGSLAEW